MIEVASGGDTIPVPAFAPSIRTQHAINRPMSNSHRHEVLPMSNSHRVAPAQSEESENSAGIGQGLGHPNTRGQPSPGVFRGRRMTYAQLIEKAILSTPNKEMPLCEIYDWLSRCVNSYYFSVDVNLLIRNVKQFGPDAVNGPSDVSWKNSVRHNLSLRPQFVRLVRNNQRSLWTVNV